MDEQALLRLRIQQLEEENQLLKKTLIVKNVEVEECKCGTPHKLYVFSTLTEED